MMDDDINTGQSVNPTHKGMMYRTDKEKNLRKLLRNRWSSNELWTDGGEGQMVSDSWR